MSRAAGEYNASADEPRTFCMKALSSPRGLTSSASPGASALADAACSAIVSRSTSSACRIWLIWDMSTRQKT
jgi:hypothetical protein